MYCISVGTCSFAGFEDSALKLISVKESRFRLNIRSLGGILLHGILDSEFWSRVAKKLQQPSEITAPVYFCVKKYNKFNDRNLYRLLWTRPTKACK